MKILCFTDCLGAGGAQRQLVGLAVMLHQKGYDVKVCYYFDIPFYKEFLEERGIRHELIPSANSHIKRFLAVTKYFRQEKPDWVIAYQETPSICGCVARLFNHRFKLIVSERNTTQHTDYKERIRFNLFRMADVVVPNAYSQEDYIKRTFPFLSDKVVTIPNFVDLDYFVPSVKRKRRETPEVMVAASIWASKNTLGFIDVVAVLKEKGHKFHISWYGLNEKNKGYCDQCQEKIERLGVGDCIELMEKANQIKERYQNADFFCLPSFYEGTPNVICEAMACGLPIACSNVCDNSRYVKEGENGYLFDPLDGKNMADTISRMLSASDNEYDTFCANSRRLAEKLLSPDTFVDNYLKLINSPS